MTTPQRQVITHLYDSMGITSHALEKSGVTLQEHHGWLVEDPEYAAAVGIATAAAIQARREFIISTALQAADDLDAGMIKYLLQHEVGIGPGQSAKPFPKKSLAVIELEKQLKRLEEQAGAL